MNSGLAVNGLTFTYPGEQTVLREIDCVIRPGERVGLIGPNGSGKTTLFMLLCGIFQPDNGTITVNETVVEKGKFNPAITYVFQQPDDQLFCTSVREDVAFGPRNMGLEPPQVETRVDAALQQVALQHKADAVPHHMSGGEKRMAAFASVLAMQPEVILLDEPASNLDARNRRTLIQILHDLDTTLVIASHDLEFILEVCERVMIIDDGRIRVDGKPSEIMGDADLMQAHHMEKPHSLFKHTHGELSGRGPAAIH